MSDDREWQHPAEHAAVNSPGFIMSPPPLAKRLVILTATISLLTSFAVLFVAIPKGIDEYVESPESSTTTPIVKGSLATYFSTLTANGVTSCAVQISPSLWVASADNLASVTTGTVNGIDIQDSANVSVRLYRSASVPYLVVASTTPRSQFPPNLDFSNSRVSAAHLSQASVVDCLNHRKMSIQESATQFAEGEETPVYVSGDVHGMAVVLSKSNEVVGFISEHNHAHWLLKPRLLTRLITTAR